MRLFVLSVGMGALLQQRMIPVFHASSVATAKGAVIFTGPTGAANLFRGGVSQARLSSPNGGYRGDSTSLGPAGNGESAALGRFIARARNRLFGIAAIWFRRAQICTSSGSALRLSPVG